MLVMLIPTVALASSSPDDGPVIAVIILVFLTVFLILSVVVYLKLSKD
jgi:hypothetical protein